MGGTTPALASAQAQAGEGQPASTTAYAVEDIIVTARKRAENLQDTPIAITAFSAAGIEARGLTNIAEINSFAPNLTFRNTAAFAATSSASSIYIRGIGQQDWALATDPGVGVYVDGVYVARSIGGVLDMLDVERIEVLKGPQGTLFGRNTIGGAISITTRKPSFDGVSGSGEITIGRYSRADFRLSLNLPLSDSLAVNFAGSRKSRDGYVRNLLPGGPDLGDEGSWAGRASLLWKASPDLDVYLAVDGSRDRTNPAANVLIAANENAIFPLIANGLELDPTNPVNRYGKNPSANCLNQGSPARLSDPTCFNAQWIAGPYRTYSQHLSTNPLVNALIPGHPLSPDTGTSAFGASLDLNWQVGDSVSIRSISAYRKISGFWSRDSDHSPLTVLQTTDYYKQDQFSQEIQVQGKTADNRLAWLVGGYYFEEQGTHIDIIELAGAVFNSGGLVKSHNKALFGQFTYDITDQLSVTLGGRYTDETKKFNPKSAVAQDNGLGIPAGVPVLPDRWEAIHARETTPYVNLAYKWTPDVMTYASYSKGFKSGTFTQRVFPPRPDIPSARPEKVDAYEIGFKSSWADSHVRLNGALFWTDYKDMQINVSEATPGTTEIGTITRNAARARIRGGELELHAVPADNLVLEGGLGYLDARYRSLEPGAQLTLNNRLVNTPKWSVNAAIAYSIAVADGWMVTPRVDYAYTSTIANDAANTPLLIQKPVSLLNAALRLTDADALWAVTAMVKNITNRSYLVAGVNDQNAGVIEGVFSHPREWSLSVRRTF
ncbi:TonB-dependent receptor [Sphingomonas flavalba]|uniref:TonB-dependent receptor n=1 Tax=Sphingomonas flavalba TaxID=2559804 RepID=UPI0039E0A8A5